MKTITPEIATLVCKHMQPTAPNVFNFDIAVEIAIRSSLKQYKDSGYRKWASDWLLNKDRSQKSARDIFSKHQKSNVRWILGAVAFELLYPRTTVSNYYGYHKS